MNKKLLFLVSFLLLSMMYAVSQPKAHSIIFNASIHTMDEKNNLAEAVAIMGNRILAVGTNAEIMRHKAAYTKMIDAGGRTIIPGLFDTHLHLIRAGRFYNAELRWDGVKTLKRALAMLKEQAQRTPEGQWVRVVGGWNEYQFEEKRLPTLEEINEATGNVPTFILYLYGKAWLNKAGLKALKINGDTPYPTAGLIQKDNQGNPTGLLLAEPNAFILYSTLAKLPELSYEDRINSTLHYMAELNRLGVTAAMDAGGGFQNFPDDYKVTDSLNRVGKLTLRIPHFLFAQKKGTELADYIKWGAIAHVHEQEKNAVNEVDYYVAGAGENLVAEAADFENFLFPRPELPANMEASLLPVIRWLVKNRWPFRLHATYNESISRQLNVIEAVNREMSFNGLLWIIDHAETISEPNMHRIKALGGAISIQHRMAYQGEAYIHRYGIKNTQPLPPVKRMLQLGIPVGLGTDGTRVASYNPWVAVQWLVTGKTIGGNIITAPQYLIDRTAALKLLTSGAYSMIKNKNNGSIQKNNMADMIILDQDYFSIKDNDISSITSLLTVVDGKVVYAAGAFQGLAPLLPEISPAWSPVKFYGGYQNQ